MKDGEVDIIRSGPGFRANLPINGEIVLSIWGVATEDELIGAAHKQNMGRMQDIDRHEHRLAQEFAAQEVAEFRRIRARA